MFETDLPLNRLWNDYDFDLLKPCCSITESSTQNYSRDFGRMLTSNPLIVFLPKTIEQLQQFVKIVSKHKIKMSCRGKGSSAYGQSLCENGVIIDLNELEIEWKISSSNEQYSLNAPACTTWAKVVELALTMNLTVPVTLDHLDLTLAGTLNFGPIGGSSYKHGAGADNILSLQVVTLDGELHTCSETENTDLFNAVLCGLGQVAIVVSVTLSLIQVKPDVSLHLLKYDDMSLFLADQKKLYDSGLLDHLKGFAHKVESKWEYVIEAANYHLEKEDKGTSEFLSSLTPDRSSNEEMSYWKFVNQVTDMVAALGEAGKLDVPHPWYNAFLPENEIAAHLMLALDNEYLTGNEPVIIYPMNAACFKKPLFVKPDCQTFYLLGILYNTSFVATTDFPFQDVLLHNKKLHIDAKARGGCRYPVDATPFTQDDWNEHFGDKWDEFCKNKQTYDPQYLLNTGMNITPPIVLEVTNNLHSL